VFATDVELVADVPMSDVAQPEGPKTTISHDKRGPNFFLRVLCTSSSDGG
jgi:hypothetical protein